MKQEKRLYWIDIIKIIACFCVLVNHTGGYLLEYNNENTVYIIFYLLQFSICKLGVPIFIMITGFLLLNKNDSYKQIFKRIIRILIPLLIISIYVYINYNGIKKFDLGNFILRFLQKPLITPFWYLYMLIGIYIITPFIKKMIDNFNHNDFKIFFLLTLVIPGLLTFISTFSRIKFSSYFTDALFPISIVYYISGIFLSKVDLNKKI